MAYLSDFAGKNNNLNFIRLIAALAVIYGHAYAVVPGHGGDWVVRTTGYAFAGGVAVDIFFLISGFLVTGSILAGGARHYLLSRFLRIYPALWVHLILIVFILGPMLSKLPATEYFSSHDVWSYFLNLAGTYQGAFFLPGVFADNPDKAVNGSIWSVLIEVWLYLVLFVFYIVGILRSRWVFNVVFFVLIIAVWNDSSWVPSGFSGTTNLHVCLMFYIGAFLYVNRDMISLNPLHLIFALFLCGITIGSKGFPFAYVLLLISLFCLVSFHSQFSWLSRYGDYSYGVYLYGWPSQQLVAMNFPSMLPLENAFWSGLLALFCGVLSWHLIERPALALKRFSPRKHNSPEQIL